MLETKEPLNHTSLEDNGFRIIDYKALLKKCQSSVVYRNTNYVSLKY
ncbi:hypothetical protein HMPREF9714_00981 [Myroides odoratimimus CCUG 12901]|uniref:Uncharacterized protein n=1 Tax=Myroides odoratimimus CIP 101113 TaxID=883154 RepID=A0AAV3F5L9_9FLAO|nr:hypothetical protein MYRA21_2075 [Myroides sp. A21]EHO13147.1 hypothetical protein HMPREF9714_00981 [Myroides odoratimimus CCUG 12901]EHO13942.1 hypothetical protein HMPREF9715_01016 [Myroides odoratimimus CIP 101113]EPH11431.1 hypothetical protein HMPREF9713_01917 [Myroides odoratimimus CCUG 12700]SHL75910.1 hypothetical protein SAMN05444275_106145 [Myroides odoratimimus subsp. xuanwuensis]STZ47579.1 Uncharacterised protein [Myroides odoratimimus]